MWHIIKLRNNVMPDIWSSKTSCLMYLRAEMAENDNSGLVFPEEDRAHEKLKVFDRLSVTIAGRNH
jgi:hypothetical protein